MAIRRAAPLLILLGSPAAAADPAGAFAVTASPAPPAAIRGTLLPERRRGLQFSDSQFVIDGSRGSSTALLGSLPVTDALDVGVGLFSVVGTTEREMVRRRTDPAHEIRSRETRVAAIGMSLRF